MWTFSCSTKTVLKRESRHTIVSLVRSYDAQEVVSGRVCGGVTCSASEVAGRGVLRGWSFSFLSFQRDQSVASTQFDGADCNGEEERCCGVRTKEQEARGLREPWNQYGRIFGKTSQIDIRKSVY